MFKLCMTYTLELNTSQDTSKTSCVTLAVYEVILDFFVRSSTRVLLRLNLFIF